jgi:hypothetical protein
MGRPAGQATTPRNHGIVGRAERRSQLGRILHDVIDDCSRFVIMGGDAAAGKTTKRASENGPLVVIMEDIHWLMNPPGMCSASWLGP